MDNPIIYGGVLVAVALIALISYKNNNMFMFLVALVVGGLVIYSHETGKGADDFKQGIHDTINDPAEEYSKKYDTDMYDADKASRHVK